MPRRRVVAERRRAVPLAVVERHGGTGRIAAAHLVSVVAGLAVGCLYDGVAAECVIGTARGLGRYHTRDRRRIGWITGLARIEDAVAAAWTGRRGRAGRGRTRRDRGQAARRRRRAAAARHRHRNAAEERTALHRSEAQVERPDRKAAGAEGDVEAGLATRWDVRTDPGRDADRKAGGHGAARRERDVDGRRRR